MTPPGITRILNADSERKLHGCFCFLVGFFVLFFNLFGVFEIFANEKNWWEQAHEKGI